MTKPKFKKGMTVMYVPHSALDIYYYGRYGITEGTLGIVDMIAGVKGPAIWSDPMRFLLAVSWQTPQGEVLIGTDWRCVRPVNVKTLENHHKMGSPRKSGKIVLMSGDYNFLYEIVPEDDSDTRSVLVQSDWDYPATARTFGWRPKKRKGCAHPGTDGTVDCKTCGKTATEFIAEAQAYLDDHIGKKVPDPGYFD